MFGDCLSDRLGSREEELSIQDKQKEKVQRHCAGAQQLCTFYEFRLDLCPALIKDVSSKNYFSSIWA